TGTPVEGIRSSGRAHPTRKTGRSGCGDREDPRPSQDGRAPYSFPMTHLDTSVLINAFSGAKSSAPALRQLLDRGERIFISTLVLFEWRRGPRIPEQIDAQEALFPSSEAIPFGSAEALLAADVY